MKCDCSAGKEQNDQQAIPKHRASQLYRRSTCKPIITPVIEENAAGRFVAKPDMHASAQVPGESDFGVDLERSRRDC